MEKDKFIGMVKEFVFSKSTMIFKINIVKSLDKNTLPSLHFMKNYFKTIKAICEENANEFKYGTRNLFKPH